MTTVIDPSGTATAVYNRSGTTVVYMTPANSFSAGGNGGVEIPRASEVTVVVATCVPDPTPQNYCLVRLPSDAEIGDRVEVCMTNAGVFVGDPPIAISNLTVFPPEGEAIAPNDVSNGTNPSAGVTCQRYGAIFRKVASDVWSAVI